MRPIHVAHLTPGQRQDASLRLDQINALQSNMTIAGAYAEGEIAPETLTREQWGSRAQTAASQHDEEVAGLEALAGPYSAEAERDELMRVRDEGPKCPSCEGWAGHTTELDEWEDCRACEGTGLAPDARILAIVEGGAQPETLQEYREARKVWRARYAFRERARKGRGKAA